MKENAPKKTWFQTLRTLWVPLAIGVVTVAALAVVVATKMKRISPETSRCLAVLRSSSEESPVSAMDGMPWVLK